MGAFHIICTYISYFIAKSYHKTSQLVNNHIYVMERMEEARQAAAPKLVGIMNLINAHWSFLKEWRVNDETFKDV